MLGPVCCGRAVLCLTQTPVAISTRLLAARGMSEMVSGSKRKPVRIGTHSGTFHCDEALGCFMLKQTSAFRECEIVRSRDSAVLSDCDVIIDVGGVYEPNNNRFDHHQRGFEEVFGFGFNTKLSSAGLVYKHFGKELIASMMKLPLDHPDVQIVYLQVYKNFIESVDAIDNGVKQYDTDAPARSVWVASVPQQTVALATLPGWTRQQWCWNMEGPVVTCIIQYMVSA
eukprot:GHUV01020320.1.p1 GENE.GHUV01020320.1~~GHUV01020320.1.p1  ORF type:complete len:227 (+),score=47.31 GHUV01020320.1:702-1382(+)